MKTMILLAAAISAAWLLTSPCSAASFDCNKATAPDELAICANTELSRRDEAVSAAYVQAMKRSKDKASLRTAARGFLVQRSQCKWDEECIRIRLIPTFSFRIGTISVFPWPEGFRRQVSRLSPIDQS